MPDLISTLQLSAPEIALAVGGLALLMIGAFAGNRAVGLVSGLSVALLVAATWLTVSGSLSCSVASTRHSIELRPAARTWLSKSLYRAWFA